MKTRNKHTAHNTVTEQKLTLTREEMDILRMIQPLIIATEDRIRRTALDHTKAVLNVVSPHRLVPRVELKIFVELPVHHEDNVN